MLSSIPKNNLIAAVIVASSLTSPVLAAELEDGTMIRDDDLARLDQYSASAGQALLTMMSVAPEGDRNAVADALAGETMPIGDALQILPGDWSCQMMKLGGSLGAIVYQPFKCAAGDDGSFEKLTGSQRTKGAIHRDSELLIYLGTGFIHDDPNPPAYSDLPVPADPQSLPQRVPEVGIVQVIDEKRARIMFPDPLLESRFNVLLLTR